MNLLIITTYNLPNLIISLSGVRRFLEQNTTHKFAIAINNDNPAYDLTPEFVSRYLPRHLSDHVLLVNPANGENLAHMRARLKIINKAYEWMKEEHLDFRFFMFIDDDDVILTPDFNSKKLEISHLAVVTHRLLEVLTLIDNPHPDKENKFIEYEGYKMGCVGVPYDFKTYAQFIQYLYGFMPTLYKIYGSEIVQEPDDIFLMNLWHVWLQKFVDRNLENLIDKKEVFSYSLTYIEDRKGRYEVPEGVVDLRYGNWDGKTTYASLVQPVIDAFVKYCNNNPYRVC